MWTFETLGALIALAMASAWTPGPNNAMLAASGATFGMARTLPHALGVTFGFPLMIFVIALGLGEAFQESRLLREILRWVGAGLLLWIAFRIATATRPGAGAGRSRPFTFVQAAAFQWVNPKAWVMCMAISSQFITGAAPVAEALTCAAIFMVVGGMSSHSWAGFGAVLGRWLADDRKLRFFNLTMAMLVAAGVVILLLSDLGAGS